MNLQERFINHIRHKNLFQQSDKILLALSGGMDSVVLFHLLVHSGFEFSAAHVNYGLRGEESNMDEAFVRDLTSRYSIPLFLYSPPAPAKAGLQENARNLRYDWFNKLSGENFGGQAKILTAHHADDNIETLLHHFFRGTGIHGLTGMPEINGNIRRPLLSFTREELKEYANANQLTWREDSSNITEKYTRNYFRNNLLPGIRKIFPEVEKNLINNIIRFREASELYGQAVSIHRKKLLEQRGNEYFIPVRKLLKSAPLHTILFEILKEFGFNPAQVNEVLKLTQSESGKYILSDSHRILKNREWLIISPLAGEQLPTQILIEEPGHNKNIPGGLINGTNTDIPDGSINASSTTIIPGGSIKASIQVSEKIKIDPSANVASLDAGQVQFPLIIRHWKAGDYFYPLGMRKKKKVSRFLIDNKVPATQKEKILVVEMNKKIIWIVGKRIDDRFKVTDKTKRILQLRLESN